MKKKLFLVLILLAFLTSCTEVPCNGGTVVKKYRQKEPSSDGYLVVVTNHVVIRDNCGCLHDYKVSNLFYLTTKKGDKVTLVMKGVD